MTAYIHKRALYAIRYTLYAFVISILAFTSFSAYCYPKDHLNVRVCVAKDKKKILLSVRGNYCIKALNSELELDKGKNLKKEYVFPTNSGIKLGGKEFKIYGIRIIPTREAAIFVDKKCFRGIVDIVRTKKLELMVVNHLDIEKYLYGVLSREVPHYWPMETLKAQAVAARTFALWRKEMMCDKDYDVTSDIYAQVYGGRSSERWRTKRAADLTKGEILKYRGKLLPAYYHSKCGGHTENAKEVFEINLPPLAGRKCPYCRGARGMRWKAEFYYKDMEKKLTEYGIKVKGVRHVAEGKRDISGRLKTLKVKDQNGVNEVKGFKFRLALDPNKIRSANFTVKNTPKYAVFRGKGWGHGVGMCQWGAFGMAKRHFSYKEILKFYYPGAKIVSYKR